MKLTNAIQEALLAILCYKSEGASLVEVCVPPQHFDPIFADVAEAAINFRREFKTVPGDTTLDLVESLGRRFPDRKKLYQRLLRSLEQTRENVVPEYVLKQASAFAQYQKLRRGLKAAFDEMEKPEPDVAAAQGILAAAIKNDDVQLFDPGLKVLQDPARALRFLQRDEFDVFPTGIREIDRVGFGPIRKGLHLLIGISGKGKSWWLLHLVKHALLRNLRAVYITLELPEQMISQRMMMSWFAITKRQMEVIRCKLKRNKAGRWIDTEEIALEGRPSFSDPNIEDLLRKRIDRFKHKPSPIVKEFPTKGIDVAGIEAYLDMLESTESVIPDLVCVDYPDLIASKIRERRFAIEDIYQRLRGIAMERNIALAVVSQASGKKYENKKLITTAGATEGYEGKIGTSDIVLTFNRTMQEEERHLARLYAAKGRTDLDSFMVLISQAYEIGAFCTDSAYVSGKEYWQKLEGDEDDDGSE